MTKKLKMFVWEDVFCDWSCGLAVALAYTKEEAIELIGSKRAKLHKNKEWIKNWTRNELGSKEPIICEEPVGFAVSGGG